MAKKRKKTVQPSPKKQEVEHFKLFCRKLKEFFEACNHGELYSLIDPISLVSLYLMRYRPPKIVFESDVKFTPNERNVLKKEIFSILRNTHYPIPYTENKITLYDYLTVFFDARTIIRPTTKVTCNGIEHIVETMKPIYEELFSEESFESKLNYICNYLKFCLTQIDKSYIYTECHQNDNSLDPYNYHFTYHIGAVQSTKIQVNLDGHNRPAFQLGWTKDCTYFPIRIKAEMLGLDPEKYPARIEVYIQNHALIRLKERIDVMDNFYRTTSILLTFVEPEIVKTGKNQYLFAFKFEGYKLGYFQANFHDNKLIVRTFLLPTCCGTPEETKLRALTGFKKSDYDFLNLGKLSTLVCSDFHKNERTRALLEEAGFKSILDYARENESKINNPICLSDRFLNYLKTDYAVYSL